VKNTSRELIYGQIRRKGLNADVKKHYDQLMEKCKIHMDQMEKELPESRIDFKEALADRGSPGETSSSDLRHDGGVDAAAHVQTHGGPSC